MAPSEHEKFTVMRTIVSAPEDFIVGLEMITKADEAVEAAYVNGTQRLDIHIPDEDIPYQRKWGGTPDEPVLRGMVNAEGNPVIAMTCHLNRPFFKRFAESVLPVFTSEERLNGFVTILRQNHYVVPIDRVVGISLLEDIKRGILNGQIMVNPLPEVFMGTFPFFDPTSNSLTLVRSDGDNSPSKQKADLANDHNCQGLIYMREQRLEDAIREFLVALTQSPDYSEARHNLGVAYSKKCEWDKAISVLQAALRIIPNDAETHNALGVAYCGYGQLDNAIREYQMALWLKPDYDKARYNLKGAYEQYDEQDETVSGIRARLKNENSNDVRAFMHLGLGAHYATQKRMEDAIQEFRVAVQLTPNDEGAHWTLGMTYESMQQWDAAITEWESILRINPDYNIHKRMGFAYAKKESWNNAARRFQIAVHFSPDDAEAHYYLALVYRQQGQLSKAAAEAQIAIQLGWEPAREMLVEMQASKSGGR